MHHGVTSATHFCMGLLPLRCVSVRRSASPLHALTAHALGPAHDMCAQAAHIMDRMANQNMFEEIAMDFKYWEDASDAFRQAEGVAV